ncbi:MAG: metallophosphoesterase [Christensenella sp.]
MKKHKQYVLIFIIIAFFAVNISVFLIGENEFFAVTEFEICNEKITEPITIVQLSDPHEKSFGENNSRLFSTVANLHPDIIFITGDIIRNSYTKNPNIAYMESFAKQCAQIAPSFFVTGNHDRYHARTVKNAFSQNGVAVLDENVLPFTVGKTTLNIGGIDDPSIDKNGISKISFTDKEHFNILLAHNPAPFRKTYDKTGADLVFCGHTHGGQVRFPFGKALFTPDDGFAPQYSDGVYTSGSTTMVLSMGLGSSVFPLRIFAQPEITVVHLLAPNNNLEPKI